MTPDLPSEARDRPVLAAGLAQASPQHANVVDFPGNRQTILWDSSVERINQFDFYDLGVILQKMRTLEGEVHPGAIGVDFLSLHRTLAGLVAGKPIDPGVSRGKLTDLKKTADDLYNRHFKAADGSFRWPPSDAPPLDSWEIYYLNKNIENFETVFREVVKEAATYRVGAKGIFDIPRLVDRAHEHFPEELRPVIPQKTIEDWCAAGRSLAFSLYTASGFHVCRAVEGTMEAYYQLFSGKPKTLNSWGDYLKALEALDDSAPHGKPSERTIAELAQMKTDFRNPIAHPRVVLKEGDARMLFANGETAIIAMCQEIRDAQQKAAAPALAIVGPAA